MSDQRLRDLGIRIEDSTSMQPFEALVRRARRRVAVQRAVGLVAVVALTLGAGVGLAQLVDGGDRSGQPADHKEQDQRQQDIFAKVHGWIVYGDLARPDTGSGPEPGDGIWAVDPTGRGGPDGTIHLTRRPGEEPIGWSRDGTKLLIRRLKPAALDNEDYAHAVALVVLNADGTETRLTRPTSWGVDGSISPDGSQVIYSRGWDGDGIYVVGTDGGTPRLLRAPVPRRYAVRPPGMENTLYPVGMSHPVLSPDGSRIAYIDGMGDWGNSLRVMRSDGSDVQVLIKRMVSWHVHHLEWSPDGRRLLFSGDYGEGRQVFGYGLWIIGVDGSGLRKVVSDGVNPMNPTWSPDGTRIAYQPVDENDEPVAGLRFADVDGRHTTELGYGGSGPWNPLPHD